jgi:catechol 2,3-dioxygenase-like lactoylglutathione lyase family enzyme
LNRRAEHSDEGLGGAGGWAEPPRQWLDPALDWTTPTWIPLRKSPMAKPRIIGSAPILLVRDVVAAAAYYRDRLGFRHERFWGEPPSFCMPVRDGHVVMLSQVDDPQHIVPHYRVVPNMWNVYFWVDDVEAMYAELTEREAKIDYHLDIKPYGVKEFGVQDLDGYDIAFGQDLGE